MRKVIVLTLLILPFLFVACEKSETNDAKVRTLNISQVGKTSCRVTANFINVICPEQPQRGVCWSTTQAPTILDEKVSTAACNGGETFDLTNLTSKTKYFVRAYCLSTNGTGIIYGNEISFTTQ